MNHEINTKCLSLGQFSLKKIAPKPKTDSIPNSNPKSNPNRGNFPETVSVPIWFSATVIFDLFFFPIFLLQECNFFLDAR